MSYKGNSTAKKKVDGEKYRKHFDEIFSKGNSVRESFIDMKRHVAEEINTWPKWKQVLSMIESSYTIHSEGNKND